MVGSVTRAGVISFRYASSPSMKVASSARSASSPLASRLARSSAIRLGNQSSVCCIRGTPSFSSHSRVFTEEITSTPAPKTSG